MAPSQHMHEVTLVDDGTTSYASNLDLVDSPVETRRISQNSVSGMITGKSTKSTLCHSPLPPYIPFDPPSQTGRTLVLCFDGTGDQFDADNSNVVQLVSMLKKDDKTKQMVYYQAGIGTYTSPAFVTPVMTKISKLFDEMFAWNLDAHVLGGYEFLMQNYREGDKICIFGFSRGAYIARSLAGMLHKVGLIPAENHQQVPFAYQMYTNTKKKGWEQSNAFKRAFSVAVRDVKIEFVGVWDTVDSVGIRSKRLPFTTSNTIVKTFRHAISLDERRSKFKANLWNRPTEKEQRLAVNTYDANAKKLQALQVVDDDQLDAVLELKNSNQSDQPTDIDQVWFAGCHCDVGGGSIKNGTRYSLARIPLRWMIRQCFETETRILFHTASLYTIGIDPSKLLLRTARPPPLLEKAKELVVEKSPSFLETFFGGVNSNAEALQAPLEERFISEEEEELRDALSPKFDQLKLNPWWWIAEILPVTMRYQKDDDEWVDEFKWNKGRPRIIPRSDRSNSDGKVHIHRSVKLRMAAQYKREKGYQPKAQLPFNEMRWVD